MPDFPVMFTFREAVSGDGYLAGVTYSGRATMREEDGKWWMHGVSPSGISAAGSTPEEVFLRFRETYRYVLFDLSEGSETFKAFKSEINSLFLQCNEIEGKCWDTAFQLMRAGEVPTEGYFSELPTRSPENNPPHYDVQRLDQPNSTFKSSDNITDCIVLPLAA